MQSIDLVWVLYKKSSLLEYSSIPPLVDSMMTSFPFSLGMHFELLELLKHINSFLAYTSPGKDYLKKSLALYMLTPANPAWSYVHATYMHDDNGRMRCHHHIQT